MIPVIFNNDAEHTITKGKSVFNKKYLTKKSDGTTSLV